MVDIRFKMVYARKNGVTICIPTWVLSSIIGVILTSLVTVWVKGVDDHYLLKKQIEQWNSLDIRIKLANSRVDQVEVTMNGNAKEITLTKAELETLKQQVNTIWESMKLVPRGATLDTFNCRGHQVLTISYPKEFLKKDIDKIIYNHE